MSTRASEPPSSEITSESAYLGRREFLKNGALMAGTAVAVGSGLLWLVGAGPPPDAGHPKARFYVGGRGFTIRVKTLFQHAKVLMATQRALELSARSSC